MLQQVVSRVPFAAALSGAQTGLSLQAWAATPVTWETVAPRVPATEGDPGEYTATLIVNPCDIGVYLVVWDTGESPPAHLYVDVFEVVGFPGVPGITGDALPVAPSVDDVAALMQGRLHDDDGHPRETFDDTTPVTATQVASIIEGVRQEVAARLQVRIPVAYALVATSVVAIGAVAYIEQGFYPETTQESDSSYTASRTVFLGRLNDLAVACQGAYTVRLA